MKLDSEPPGVITIRLHWLFLTVVISVFLSLASAYGVLWLFPAVPGDIDLGTKHVVERIAPASPADVQPLEICQKADTKTVNLSEHFYRAVAGDYVLAWTDSDTLRDRFAVSNSRTGLDWPLSDAKTIACLKDGPKPVGGTVGSP